MCLYSLAILNILRHAILVGTITAHAVGYAPTLEPFSTTAMEMMAVASPLFCLSRIAAATLAQLNVTPSAANLPYWPTRS